MPNGFRPRRFERMVRAVGPLVAMAALGGLASAREKGWQQGKWAFNFGPGSPGPGKGGKFRVNGREGVPLDQLDMGTAPVTQVVLVSGDHVTISQGEPFAIAVQGSEAAKARVRFAVEDGALFVLRDDGAAYAASNEEPAEAETSPDAGVATICVTMPPPEKLTIAGSGALSTAILAPEAELVIAGSGTISADGVAARRLDVTVAGSGQVRAEGSADQLAVSVMGSGKAALPRLRAATAEIDIAGSGKVLFASDGEVEACIMGSGNVTVRGSARCRVKAMGSGALVCEREPDPGDQPATAA